MPEHVHLLASEPTGARLSLALQILKQQTSCNLSSAAETRFLQRRYYDFNVWSQAKLIEKLKYMHRNPVKRGLVARPEDWRWSSSRHHATGEPGVIAEHGNIGLL